MFLILTHFLRRVNPNSTFYNQILTFKTFVISSPGLNAYLNGVGQLRQSDI